jgi:hypothetical protein
MRRLHPPSGALVVAFLALFVALSGVGYAAFRLPKGSVKSRHLAPNSVTQHHIVRNAVRRTEIASGAVASAEVANRSLRVADFAPGAVPGPTYVGYLQPKAGSTSIDVGWESKAVTPSALTYLAPGQYRVEFARENNLGCPVPVATPFTGAAGVTFRVVGAVCNATTGFFELATSNGQDTQFFLQVGFSS